MKITPRLTLVDNYERQDGKYPVKVRIIHRRVTRDYKTPLYFTKEEYQHAIHPNPPKKFRHLKIQLDAVSSKMYETINNIENFTFQKFRNNFYGEAKAVSDVYFVFEEFIEWQVQQGRFKNSVNYTTALNSFKKYKKSLSFYDVNVEFLTKYHNWMLDSKSKSETTISMYVRALRTIVNYAVSKNYLKKDFEYPFGEYRYQVPGGRKVKKALSTSAIQALFDYKAIPFSMEDRAKDFWLFSYMCSGMNVNDIIRLKISNLDNNMLRYHRGKTYRTTQSNRPLISVSLEESIFKIMQKWGNLTQGPEDYIFPILDKEDFKDETIVPKRELFTRSLNKYLKRICKDLNFTNLNITMIHARHSAATQLKNANIPIFQISESLGHTNPNTTRNYMADFDDSSKIEVTKTLTRFNLAV